VVEDVALTGFPARLARTLLRLAGGGSSVQATHEQLAGETASGRAVVSRQLARFAEEGLVETLRGEIRLCDPGALVRLARDG
jgi:CRP/FNR family transcriptional regulator